jgi:hypothetical protein
MWIFLIARFVFRRHFYFKNEKMLIIKKVKNNLKNKEYNGRSMQVFCQLWGDILV